MAENSGIEWTHHTFNPWIGCTKISAACDNCYAEAWDNRGLQGGPSRWGVDATRTRTKTWRNPIKWQKKAVENDVRYRVFTASLADVFDNHKSIEQSWRDDLWSLIRECPNLDFLLLTKRPQNIKKYLPSDWGDGYPNVWLGCTVESQKEADRLRHLTSIPAAVRFLSMEPLLSNVNLASHINSIDWVIVGGESHATHRPAKADWFRSIRDQCIESGVPFLFKQWSGKNQKDIKSKGRALDGVEHNGYPSPRFTQSTLKREFSNDDD